MIRTRALAGIVGILLSVISLAVGVVGQSNAPAADVIVPVGLTFFDSTR